MHDHSSPFGFRIYREAMGDVKPKKSWSAWHGPLNDASIMPFGMHKGKQMSEVPDSYLLGLFQKLKEDNSIYPDSMGDRVREYIAQNIDVIEKNAASESTNSKG